MRARYHPADTAFTRQPERTTGESAQPAYLADVRDYYEQNTAWFGMVQRRNHDLAIHRPVWAAGIEERRQALNYVNAQIAARIEPLLPQQEDATPANLLDLGCGFGATLFYLAERFSSRARVTGVTISRQQAQLVQMRIREKGLRACAVLEADFQAVPVDRGMTAVSSIEAFAHAYAPERYMAEAARLLKPGGRLILCDDFRADATAAQASRSSDARWIKLFQVGWHIPRLLSTRDVTDLARQCGLHKIEEIDLSPYLHLRTFPNALIPLFESAMQHGGAMTPMFESVLGGFALEECTRQGLIAYRFLVFEK